MRLSALFLLISSVISCTAGPARKLPGPAHSWTTELQEALEASRRTGRLVGIFFHRPDCTACRELETETLMAPEVQRELASFICVRVDVTETPEIAHRYNVARVPDMRFVNRHGHEISAIYSRAPGAVASTLREIARLHEQHPQ